VARPNGNDERDSEFGYGRTQPEFSLGERMATMEAQLGAQEENLKERKAEQKELFGEQIKSVRDDIAVKDKAQKDAVTKAEGTATSAATALATELRQYREATDTRLGALERGGAAGPVDIEARLRLVERREAKVVGGGDQVDKLWAILATLAAVVLTIVLVAHGG
jgi:hypothetical protein